MGLRLPSSAEEGSCLAKLLTSTKLLPLSKLFPLLLGFVVLGSAATKQAAEESADTLHGFADSFSGFGHTFLHGFGNAETVKRAI